MHRRNRLRHLWLAARQLGGAGGFACPVNKWLNTEGVYLIYSPTAQFCL